MLFDCSGYHLVISTMTDGTAMLGFDEATYSELSGHLHDAVVDDSSWSLVIGVLKQRFGVSSGNFGFCDTTTSRQLQLHSDCDPVYGIRFIDNELGNPFRPTIASGAVGEVVIDAALVSRDTFFASTFYNEWMRPQGEHTVLAVPMWRSGSAGAHLSLLRGGHQRPFDNDDIEALEPILPLMRRSIELRLRIGAQRLGQLAADHDGNEVGMLVVDRHRRLLLANAAGEAMLADADLALWARQGVVSTGLAREALERAVFAACNEGYDDVLAVAGDMLLDDVETRAPLATLSVLPLRDAPMLGLPTMKAALLLIKPLAPRMPSGLGQRLRNLFDLTPREAELAE
ncbi:MAG: hypothetical protein EOP93_15975, partial [Lysobacteraceae bacterium]